MGRAALRRPIAPGFADGIFERPASRIDPRDSRSKQSHPENIECLALHIFRSHINFTLKPEHCCNSGRRHPMLSRTSFSDDARLFHPLCEKPLSNRIINFVGPGVTEVFTLQIDLRPTQSLRESLGKVERSGSPDVMLQVIGKFRLEAPVLFY